MKAVLQRVTEASVTVDNKIVSQISDGFLVLLGVAQGDDEKDADVLAKKIAFLRVFEDENGRMNRSLQDTGGAVLAVSQFTLLANCVHGRRPDFFAAEKPERANELYLYFCERIKENGISQVEQGVFGADMKVALTNDGPVTILLDSKELKK